MTILNWRMSSYCGEGNSCLNLAATPGGTLHLRESETPETVLTTAPATLRAFIDTVKTGKLDHLNA
ncbi:DUF397 domain-containing protein [Streptomyces zagrosensis]|uniref:DUF397 domain-containing protein n=1 Tax=Streptomyces zagrosensis TaxID=1042984 RepID=A0A7W9QEY3_9ACTN|nr:DUF397 domain-containing protein [Streptomyces zagrosensis]MBB5937977.1 hypothetical protein [Streptomyces zagrosensis]